MRTQLPCLVAPASAITHSSLARLWTYEVLWHPKGTLELHVTQGSVPLKGFADSHQPKG